MKIRALDATGDMQFGHGQRDFIANVPAVVAQRARTRINLWQGDFFLDIQEGTPIRTQVLGMRTNATRDPAVRARVLGTPGCKSIIADASQLDRQSRLYAAQVTIDTAFGRTVVETSTSANDDVRQAR